MVHNADIRKEWSTKRFYEQKVFYSNIDRFREKIRETLKLVNPKHKY